MPTYLLRNIDSALYACFKSRCALDGVSMRQALIAAMQAYCEECDREESVTRARGEDLADSPLGGWGQYED